MMFSGVFMSSRVFSNFRSKGGGEIYWIGGLEGAENFRCSFREAPYTVPTGDAPPSGRSIWGSEKSRQILRGVKKGSIKFRQQRSPPPSHRY